MKTQLRLTGRYGQKIEVWPYGRDGVFILVGGVAGGGGCVLSPAKARKLAERLAWITEKRRCNEAKT